MIKQKIYEILFKDPSSMLMILIKNDSKKIKDIVYMYCKQSKTDIYMPYILDKMNFDWDSILSSIDQINHFSNEQIKILLPAAEKLLMTITPS